MEQSVRQVEVSALECDKGGSEGLKSDEIRRGNHGRGVECAVMTGVGVGAMGVDPVAVPGGGGVQG